MSTITIPAAQLEAFRRAVIVLYSGRADALAHELVALLSDDDQVANVLNRRADLDAVADVVAQLGWASGSDRAARQVTADVALIEACYQSMLTDAVEDLQARVESSDWSPEALARLRTIADGVGDLVGRIERLSRR